MPWATPADSCPREGSSLKILGTQPKTSPAPWAQASLHTLLVWKNHSFPSSLPLLQGHSCCRNPPQKCLFGIWHLTFNTKKSYSSQEPSVDGWRTILFSPTENCHYLCSLSPLQDCHMLTNHLHVTFHSEAEVTSQEQLWTRGKNQDMGINEWLPANSTRWGWTGQNLKEICVCTIFSPVLTWSWIYLLLPSCTLCSLHKPNSSGNSTKQRDSFSFRIPLQGCVSYPNLLVFLKRVKTSSELWNWSSERGWHNRGCPLPKHLVFLQK